MDSYRGYVIFSLLIFLPTFAIAQKGSWQKYLEKELKKATSQEQKLVLQCAIAQEMKEYDLSEAYKNAHKILQQAITLRSRLAEGEAYNALGEIYRMRGYPIEAIEFYQKALGIFEKLGKENLLQRTKRDMAFTQSMSSQFDKAQIVLEKAMHWFGQYEPNSREHAISLHNLAINTLRLGRLKEAMSYVLQAQKIFKTIDDTFNQTRIKNSVGLFEKNMGYYKKGFQYYTEALQEYEKMGENQRGTSIVLVNMGNVYLTMHDTLYREPISQYFQRAYKIACQIRDTLQIAACLESLAKSEAFSRNYGKADKYFEEGVQILRRMNNVVEEGYYSLRVSDIYVWGKNYERAVDIAKKAERIFKERQAWSALAQSQYRLARYYALMLDFKTSQFYVYEVLSNAEKAHDTSIFPLLYNLLLKNSIELRQFSEFDTWSEKAIADYQNSKRADFLLDTYKSLIKADTMRKKPSALKWLLLYTRLRDSLLVLNKNKDVLEMQFKYDLKNQIHENNYLKKMNNLHTIEAQKKSVIIVAVSLALAVVAITVLVLYNNRQDLRRLLRVVREKNLAIEDKNKEIEATNEKLAKLNTTKDRILSVISHDMRSPLANLKSVLELGNEGLISLEEQAYITQKLNADIGRVQDFLQNLLFWAESQMNGFTPSLEKVELRDKVESVFAVVAQQAQKKNITLVNELPDAFYFHTDRDILNIVLLNLVSNALKFTPTAGKISIRATQEGTQACITVQDNGIGIAPQHYEKIFGSSRFTTYGTEEEKGTGFGLTLCRDFVQALGGDITFESQLQHGTTFFIRLPITQS